MIVLDMTSKIQGPLIGVQREDKKYIYLHWKLSNGLYYLTDYIRRIEYDEGIDGIGPDCLVEWSNEDEDCPF